MSISQAVYEAQIQRITDLQARLAEAERLLQGVARGGHPAGMAALLSDIDGYFKPTADSASDAPKISTPAKGG